MLGGSSAARAISKGLEIQRRSPGGGWGWGWGSEEGGEGSVQPCGGPLR